MPHDFLDLLRRGVAFLYAQLVKHAPFPSGKNTIMWSYTLFVLICKLPRR